MGIRRTKPLRTALATTAISAAFFSLACEKPPNKEQAKAEGAQGEEGSKAKNEAVAPLAGARASDSSDPKENPMTPPAFGAPTRPSVMPPIKTSESDPAGGHALLVGWSAEGHFGYCAGPGGDHCQECKIMDSIGQLEEIDDCGEDGKSVDLAARAKLEERLALFKLADPQASWAYGQELSLQWKGGEASPDGRKAPTARLGAQLGGIPFPVYSVQISEPGYESIHLDGAMLSPDGHRVGVLTHAPAVGGTVPSFQVRVASVAGLAGKAFNGAGIFHHRAGDLDKSHVAFHKATHIMSRDPEPAFNLGCALARLGAPGAQAALEEAVSRGGEAMIQRMRDDSDLESVRSEDWFKRMTGASGAAGK